MDNLSRLRAAMEQSSVPALLVTTIQNVRWLSGFTGSSAVCLVTPGTAVLITDSRYTLQARAEVQGMEVVVFQNPRSLDDVIEEQAAAAGASTIGFESSLTYGQWKKRRDRITAVDWVESPDLIRDLRMVKTADEIKRIKAACQLADACIENITGLIQVGRTEHEIGLDIEFFYRRHGAGIAFDPIVASGPNSAKPHAHPGERRIARGDFVTIDCGGRLDGYCSDITRTFVVGEASDRHREIYDLVLKAEVDCCALLLPGAQGKEVDGHARKLFAEKGLDHHFGHGLGHGLGIDVHDPGGLSPTVDQTIAEGMVFTVEPGIYIEGFGGVRIEDDVLVTAAGPEILTHAPKDLLIL